jgi:hypothetical protein
MIGSEIYEMCIGGYNQHSALKPVTTTYVVLRVHEMGNSSMSSVHDNVHCKSNYGFLGCDAVQSGREVQMFL